MSDEQIPPTARLNGETITFVQPDSISIRYAVRDATINNAALAFCAALALCWPKLQHSLRRYNHNVLDYGADAQDFLLSKGCKRGDILDAGHIAWNLCVRDLISQEEVEGQKDFFAPSEASTASTEPSPTSSEPGGSTQDGLASSTEDSR